MRLTAYLASVAALLGIAWHYPFLFELPLIGALAGAYWLCTRPEDSEEKGQ